MKINELFILHREVETRYKRAVEEIIRIDCMKEETNNLLQAQRADLDNLKKNVFVAETNLQKATQEEQYWRLQALGFKEREGEREELISKMKTEARLAQKKLNDLQKANILLNSEVSNLQDETQHLKNSIEQHLITIENERQLKENFQALSQKLRQDLDIQLEVHSHCQTQQAASNVKEEHLEKTVEQ